MRKWFIAVVVAAVALVLLVWLPAQVASVYHFLKDVAPWLATAYLWLVGALGLVIVAFGVRVVWKLWRNSETQRRRRAAAVKRPSELSAGEKQREIDQLLSGDDLSKNESIPEQVRSEIARSMSELRGKLDAEQLEIVAFGTISAGKSSLLNALVGRDVFDVDVRGGTTVQRNEVEYPGDARIVLVDTPGLAEVDDEEHYLAARRAAEHADLVLFVVDGPLKDFEFRLLEPLADMEKRVIVVLNKADWFAPSDLQKLIGQISEQASRCIKQCDVVAVRSRSSSRIRTRIAADGSEVEETVVEPPDIAPLAEQMMRIVRRDGRDLLLANLLLRSRGLVAEAKERFQAALDARAREIVNTYTWQSAAAAALAPPALDLAAAATLNVKMTLDLAKVYGQEMDFEAAKQLLGELGKNLLALLGAHAAAPVVASMLKATVPAVGHVAGGLLQGMVQALVTRWVGRVFIEYFRTGMREPPDGWAGLARAKWEAVTAPAELASFAREAMARLRGKSA